MTLSTFQTLDQHNKTTTDTIEPNCMCRFMVEYVNIAHIKMNTLSTHRYTHSDSVQSRDLRATLHLLFSPEQNKFLRSVRDAAVAVTK